MKIISNKLPLIIALPVFVVSFFQLLEILGFVTVFGNVMSQYATLSLIFLSLIPLFNLFAFSQRIRLAEIFSLLVFILSLVSFVAISLNIAELFEIPVFFSEAIHTVFFFLISSVIMYLLFRVKEKDSFSFKNFTSIFFILLLFLSTTATVAIFLESAIAGSINTNFEVLVIVMLGIVVSLLAAIIFSMLFSSREKARQYAQEATKHLQAAKARDEALLISLPDGLIATDKQGKIMLVNEAFTKLLGYTNKEVMGKKFSSAIKVSDENGDEISPQDCLVGRALKEKKVISTAKIFFYRRKNGTTFPVASTASPVIEEGEVVGVVEVFRDITRELAVDKAKTEFVSLASHQLRTPLSIVNWYVELLLNKDAGTLNSDQEKYLNEIHVGNQRMTNLVNALLDVSKIEMGTLTIEPESVDVTKLIKEVLGELTHIIEEKQLKLKLDFAKNIPTIQADKKLIWMVFENLLTNSVKYTPAAGSVTFTMKLKRKGERVDKLMLNEDSLYFAISDTGLGIPKDQKENIFTKLFRADNVKSEDTVGSGLGLYIVKSIIERSGGRIWFDSEQNKGTTFYFILPVTSR